MARPESTIYEVNRVGRLGTMLMDLRQERANVAEGVIKDHIENAITSLEAAQDAAQEENNARE